MATLVFLSYAQEDVTHRDALQKHSTVLRRKGALELWHDGFVAAGEDRAAVARARLDEAAIVLLLLSADYLASNACHAEMDRALERARTGTVRVVPILLRPCVYDWEPTAPLSSLPSDGTPVTLWSDRDAAWADVADGVAALLGGASAPHSASDPPGKRRARPQAGAAIDPEATFDGATTQVLAKLEDARTRRRRLVDAGASTRERFFRGARVMAELEHPGIVRVFSPHEEDGRFHFFVMELVGGGDLHAAVLDGRVDREGAVPLILRVGEALAAAHHRGFIHRDVKPANILLDEQGHPKLGDFDLVGGEETTGGTGTGAMGTFVYAAPEMMSRPQDADRRADVFGLGMTALFCLYGNKLPDLALRKPERLLEQLDQSALAVVIARAIEWEPSDRFADVPSFCEALREAATFDERDAARSDHEEEHEPETAGSVAEPAELAPSIQPPTPKSTAVANVFEPARRNRPAVVAALGTAGAAVAAAVVLWSVGKIALLAGAGPSGPPSSDPSASAAEMGRAPIASPLPGQCPDSMVAIVSSGSERTAWIGSKEGVGEDDERPRHQVTLKPYCIDKTEVTISAYAECVTRKKCAVAQAPSPRCNATKPEREQPINCVTWDDAKAYCEWMGARLPREEEWEFAACGPEDRVYPWGEQAPSNQLCWDGEGSDLGKGKRDSTCPVGAHPHGDRPFGLLDMAGNVWEWTSGRHCPFLDQNCPNSSRVVRGGGWNSVDASSVRCANRRGVAPTNRDIDVGFRCARDL